MLNNEYSQLKQKAMLERTIVAKLIAFKLLPISHMFKAPEKRVMMADSKE